MRQRLAGYILWALFIAPFLLAVVAVPVALFWADLDGLRRVIRAMDNTVNAAIFNGSPYESVSSHAWRERDRAWAKVVIRLTDLLQPGHCEGANREEQPLMDFLGEK